MTKEKSATPMTRYIDKNCIIETVYQNRIPAFAILNGKGPEIAKWYKPTNEIWIKPFEDKGFNLEKGLVLLPSELKDYKSTENLLEDIRNFVSSFAYLDPFWLEVSTYYALMTWIYDCFGSVPYLKFIGDFNSGKSRMAECVAQCSYNTIMINGASTISPMFRLIDRYKGTIFIDEADYDSSDFDSMIAKILNVGYKRGVPITRSENIDGQYEPVAYEVFGPKIITQRKRFKDDATESRCLIYEVPKVSKLPDHIPIQLLPNQENGFYQQALVIRNKCLKWRFDNLKIIKPDMSINENVHLRNAEILVPLLTLIKDEKFKKQLITFMSDNAEEVKGDSDYFHCVQAIKRLKSREEDLIVGKITEEMMINVEPDKEVSAKLVGSLIRRLGLETGKIKGRRKIKSTPKNIARLDELFDEYKEVEDDL